MSTIPDPITPVPVVLLIDDHADTREAFAAYLRFAGMKTLAVASAELALQTLEEQRASVILSDLRLPGMSGLELLAKLQENPRTARIPFILLTGSGELPGERSVAALRLLKPIKPETLVGHLRQVLQGAAGRASRSTLEDERAGRVVP